MYSHPELSYSQRLHKAWLATRKNVASIPSKSPGVPPLSSQFTLCQHDPLHSPVKNAPTDSILHWALKVGLLVSKDGPSVRGHHSANTGSKTAVVAHHFSFQSFLQCAGCNDPKPSFRVTAIVLYLFHKVSFLNVACLYQQSRAMGSL